MVTGLVDDRGTNGAVAGLHFDPAVLPGQENGVVDEVDLPPAAARMLGTMGKVILAGTFRTH